MVSTAGDVYSYGVTLLEILAGKAPTDSRFEDDIMLSEFFAQTFPERIERVLDPSLLPIDELDGPVSVSISTMPTVSPPYSEESEGASRRGTAWSPPLGLGSAAAHQHRTREWA